MSKKNKTTSNNKKERFTTMNSDTMGTPAWRALSCTAKALYLILKLEWKGKIFNNNGKIQLSTNQAAYALGVSAGTAARAFRDLQAKGFIVMTHAGCLGTEGYGVSPSYEITELKPPTENLPRKIFKQWDPEHEFPVQKLSANNPNGNNGRAKNKGNVRASLNNRGITTNPKLENG